MDPVKRPPKGQSIRETIIQIVNQGGLKPNWFKDYHRNALRGQYARERISKEPHNIDEYKNYMASSLKKKERSCDENIPTTSTLLCILQCLSEASEEDFERPGPWPIEKLLESGGPVSNHFDLAEYDLDRLMCADCIHTDPDNHPSALPYAVVHDKFLNRARCIRCGSYTKIFSFREPMDKDHKQLHGGEEVAEEEAIKELASLFGRDELEKKNNGGKKYQGRVETLISDAGVNRFVSKDKGSESPSPSRERTCATM